MHYLTETASFHRGDLHFEVEKDGKRQSFCIRASKLDPASGGDAQSALASNWPTFKDIIDQVFDGTPASKFIN